MSVFLESMDPLLIILIGAAVVLFCIIRLKLHAAIALLLAALVTAWITPSALVEAFALQNGMAADEAATLAELPIGKRLATAFGNTSAKIGILIALASIIGSALMRSGAAERIIRSLLGLFGERRASLALLSGSFTLAIPVFFDTVFYLMIPLVKSMAVRQPRKFGLYLMAIVAGGVMAHSLIPPTPGPLFVAEEMGIDLGLMILGGLVIGIITISAGYAYALWANLRWQLPLRDTPDMSIADLRKLNRESNEQLPGLGISLMPIALPILLISANTVLSALKDYPGAHVGSAWSTSMQVLSTLGDPNIALFVAAVIAMILLATSLKDSTAFKKHIAEALASAAMIILITSAGGAFGQMMQQTGIGHRIGGLASGYQMALLPLAFLITAAVRSAQGSATVAMITAVGVMNGVVNMGLDFHPVYLALAIGCGSKIFAWMNDSGFWIVSKMSGMNEGETIRHFSMLMTVMALAGLGAVMIFSLLLPLT
ncbi:MAG: GntP family permease [Saprospiraceae bacterium]|nr:GntP family permease [Saprospiraceae bacterium]